MPSSYRTHVRHTHPHPGRLPCRTVWVHANLPSDAALPDLGTARRCRPTGPLWESSGVSEERSARHARDPATPARLPAAELPETLSEAPPPPPPVNVTRLIHEAASRSGLLWVRVPDGGTHPVWHVWHDDGDERSAGPAAYVDLRSWRAVAAVAARRGGAHPAQQGHRQPVGHGERDGTGALPEDPAWDAAVELIRPERLNAVGDVGERWRQSCTIHVLTPHGRPIESPGSYADASGATTVTPAAATTAVWRPWHWRGRARARRNTRSS